MCLSFPRLPLEVFTRAATEDDTRAVVVVEKHRVLCANATAEAQGIAPGISPATAQALCTNVRVRERAPAAEAAALTTLADWAYRFSPQLSLVPPDRLLLEIGASLGLFGGLAALLAGLERDLAARRWTHRCGLAPTPLAAELLATALPCTAAAPPAWCAPGGPAFAEVLGALPLALLEAPEREQLGMQRMGFRRIGELLALPRPALGRRFGKDFLRYLMRLTGELPDPRPVHRPREHFESTLHFLDPLPDVAMLLCPMRRLLGEFTQFLARRQAFCQRLAWRLAPAHGSLVTLPIACSLEHHREGALLELTRLALERLRVAEAIASLTLDCHDFAPVRGHSEDLFEDANGGSIEAERRLLDRLRLRLGEDDLHGVFPADAHLPEHAWGQVLPLARNGQEARSDPITRPCWLLREPEPVAYTSNTLAWHTAPLELLGGPERIENGWWDTSQSRDYFVARTRTGALVWVYRERNGNAWFVQGVFG